MFNDDPKSALIAAKSAVSAYAKDPSDQNAARVQFTWKVVKDLQAQKQGEMWSRTSPGPDDGT